MKFDLQYIHLKVIHKKSMFCFIQIYFIGQSLQRHAFLFCDPQKSITWPDTKHQ